MNKESKFMIGLKRVAMKVADAIVPVAIAITPGLIIGGSLVAISDNKRLKNLENKFKEHERIDDHNIEVIGNFMNKTDSQINELTRQNNQLFERALKVTEGKAS